jgi:hydrogenase/urease accessory protein HupE
MKTLAALALLTLPAITQAHPGHGDDSGPLSDLLHYFTNAEHLVALLLILAGLLAAGLAARRLSKRNPTAGAPRSRTSKADATPLPRRPSSR